MKKPWKALKKMPSEFKKHIKDHNHIYKTFNLYFQDESRFGLFTRVGRMLTAKGVQPVCPYQHKFENTYLFGAFSPLTGDSLLLELPYCNTDMFGYFLNELSKQKPDEFKMIILDNGAFHKAKRLRVPENIALIFLPPYSPELNPSELVWKYIKSFIVNKTYKSLEELSKELERIIQDKLTVERIISITSFQLYLDTFRTISEL